jgi:CHAD domain-containing protein
MELELGLNPDDAARLPRLASLAPLRSAKARSRPVRIVWHDSPDRALAQQGLALAEQRPLWRLERLRPDGQSWPPGAPAPVLASGRSPSALGMTLPDPVIPVAAFEGRAASLALAAEQGPITVTLLNGTVRAVAAEHRICRARFEGEADAVQTMAVAVAGEVRLAVPRASLAAEACALATGVAPPPRRLGAPELPSGLSAAEAFAHVVGHLTDVIVHFAPAAADGREGPEPVHQMRVAVRRLRSAIKVFRRAVRCPEVDAADAGLKALAARLAPTRDWDVFVTETSAAAARAFPDETRLRRLLAAAERRRRACHDELRGFLGSIDFNRLGIELACLAAQDWQITHPEVGSNESTAPLEEFAASVLDKRLKRLADVDDDIASLEPSALHAIRLSAKRLRYAAEIFAPLYPGKATSRFISRLGRLQDRLGALNDGAVAAHLLEELPSGNHAFATGLILGFIGAHSAETRGRIARTWLKFHRLEPFWQ